MSSTHKQTTKKAAGAGSVVSSKGRAYTVCQERSHRAIRQDKAVRSAVSFFKRATKRSDVDAIMRDLAKL